jgi:hypothetical protein
MGRDNPSGYTRLNDANTCLGNTGHHRNPRTADGARDDSAQSLVRFSHAKDAFLPGDIWYSADRFSGWVLVAASGLVICFNLVLLWLQPDETPFSFGRWLFWSSNSFLVSRPPFSTC